MVGLFMTLVLPMIVAGSFFGVGLAYLIRWFKEREKGHLAQVFKFTSVGYLVLSVFALIMVLEDVRFGAHLGIAVSALFAFSSLVFYFFYRLIKIVIEKGL